jgi:hypothetical protein
MARVTREVAYAAVREYLWTKDGQARETPGDGPFRWGTGPPKKKGWRHPTFAEYMDGWAAYEKRVKEEKQMPLEHQKEMKIFSREQRARDYIYKYFRPLW